MTKPEALLAAVSIEKSNFARVRRNRFSNVGLNRSNPEDTCNCADYCVWIIVWAHQLIASHSWVVSQFILTDGFSFEFYGQATFLTKSE